MDRRRTRWRRWHVAGLAAALLTSFPSASWPTIAPFSLFEVRQRGAAAIGNAIGIGGHNLAPLIVCDSRRVATFVDAPRY
jgi:hypothetical protein